MFFEAKVREKKATRLGTIHTKEEEKKKRKRKGKERERAKQPLYVGLERLTTRDYRVTTILLSCQQEAKGQAAKRAKGSHAHKFLEIWSRQESDKLLTESWRP